MTLSPLADVDLHADPEYNSDKPRKRLKREGLQYVPGGTGGGGHWEPKSARSARSRPSIPAQEKSRTARRPWRERTRDAAPTTATRPRRERPQPQPSFSSTADAVASVDGYKPREERGWEEFHPELDLNATICVFSANEVDGVDENEKDDGKDNKDIPKGRIRQKTPNAQPIFQLPPVPTPKRRPGRPPGRRAQTDALLNGLGNAPSPPGQRPMPLPSQNPRERLSLPKPSYKQIPSLDLFEQDKTARQINFVNKVMENLGYQKNEMFSRDAEMIRLDDTLRDYEVKPGVAANVEYDMDEQDQSWLDAYNQHRRDVEKLTEITPAIFEVTMTQIEHEWHALEKRIPKPNPKPPQTHRARSSSATAVHGGTPGDAAGEDAEEEPDSKCAICDDGDCENANAIIFCDGCDLAVHQECYGVPYIPEGQWMCRRCSQVGKMTTTCIFCPNSEGAFKQTEESKWAHLLCAMWIPEVTIPNTTYMEPISNVVLVPATRWKLTCYICEQKMGACIQCGNRACYKAFHVTCARKAKLHLKMKSQHGSIAAMDASVLKAYCHKHAPPEHRLDYDVDAATLEAQAYYRREMKGTKWADSQTSALSIGTIMPGQSDANLEEMRIEDEAQLAAATPGQRKKRLEIQKRIWRLPSGAPVVPDVVSKNIETALLRFNPLPKRKEFVAEASKYWTLKREARRGASLLKRLQAQMETFSTAEIGRRDFAALGPSGAPKLDRRIDFAKHLESEMESVQELCRNVLDREETKLSDAVELRSCVETLYFPFQPLLGPILKKANTYDEKTRFFTAGIDKMQAKLDQRAYTSVAIFSTDLFNVLRSAGGSDIIQDLKDLTLPIKNLSLAAEQKEAAKMAKRILKYAGDLLDTAGRAEADLARKPYEQQLERFQNLEKLLDARSTAHIPELPPGQDQTSAEEETNGVEQSIEDDSQPNSSFSLNLKTARTFQIAPTATGAVNGDTTRLTNGIKAEHGVVPSTEVENASNASAEEAVAGADEIGMLGPLRNGGTLWCFEPFSPNGVTIHDERWAGAARAMSADLSDMDEAELNGMVSDAEGSRLTPISEEGEVVKSAAKKTPTKKRKRRGW